MIENVGSFLCENKDVNTKSVGSFPCENKDVNTKSVGSFPCENKDVNTKSVGSFPCENKDVNTKSEPIFPPSTKSSHDHHFHYSAANLRYLRVSMAPAVRPFFFLMKKWIWPGSFTSV